MWKKQILASSISVQKGKLGVTTHFSEMIELKFRKKVQNVLCILTLF